MRHCWCPILLPLHTAPSWAAGTKPTFMAIHQCPEQSHVPSYGRPLISCSSTTWKSLRLYSLLRIQEQVKPSPSRAARLKWNTDIGPQIYSCPVMTKKPPPFVTLIETETTFISNKTVFVHYKYSPSFLQMPSIIHPYYPFFLFFFFI